MAEGRGLALHGIGALWLVPVVALVVTSLRLASSAATSGWWTVLADPSDLTLGNYRDLLATGGFVEAFGDTVWLSLPATLLPLALATGAGYAFARLAFPGRDLLFVVIVALMVVPAQMAFIPAAGLFRVTGLGGVLGGLVSLWLFHTAFALPFAVFLMRNFIAGIPREVFEAAEVDGAGHLRMLVSIVVPLSRPALAALGIFQFTWVWNDLLVALVFAGDRRPLTLFVQDRLGAFGTGLGVITPGVVLLSVVPLVLFLCAQRQFTAGILSGYDR
jgi:alpha-glucoside transport system permease protein